MRGRARPRGAPRSHVRAAAAAADTPKHRWSNNSAPTTKPPCRTRSVTALGASGSGSSAHRDAGTSLTVSSPTAAMRHAASKDCTPPGSWALVPTSAVDIDSIPGRSRTKSAAGRAAVLGACSVLGSDRLLPTACCSWLRSSTAPSESSPASISGASASTALPTVFCTIDRTVSRPIRLPGLFTPRSSRSGSPRKTPSPAPPPSAAAGATRCGNSADSSASMLARNGYGSRWSGAGACGASMSCMASHSFSLCARYSSGRIVA
eukprot:scaffold23610_cov78-Phaeocystis_antarctica.AAC.1